MTNYDGNGKKRDGKREAIKQEQRANEKRRQGDTGRADKLNNRANRFRKG